MSGHYRLVSMAWRNYYIVANITRNAITVSVPLYYNVSDLQETV